MDYFIEIVFLIFAIIIFILLLVNRKLKSKSMIEINDLNKKLETLNAQLEEFSQIKDLDDACRKKDARLKFLEIEINSIEKQLQNEIESSNIKLNKAIEVKQNELEQIKITYQAAKSSFDKRVIDFDFKIQSYKKQLQILEVGVDFQAKIDALSLKKKSLESEVKSLEEEYEIDLLQ